MNIPTVLQQHFAERQPFVVEVASQVRSTLLTYCEREGFAFLSRLKTLESVAEKIETGRFQSWSTLNDLFACTIVVPTLRQEQEAINYCRRKFEIIQTTPRGAAAKAPDTFFFDSTRIRAKLRRIDGLVTDELSIYDILFEIQVKSAFEHAWSVATHDFTYKSPTVDWRRFRLAAQMKAIVEQLDALVLNLESSLEVISPNPWPELERKQSISEVVEELFTQGYLVPEAKPKDTSRFCENLYSLLRSSGKEQDVTQAMTIIADQIRSGRPDMIPQSISLLQFFLALLTDNGFIDSDGSNYFLHITPELINLYPKTQIFTKIFVYDR